MQAIGNKTENIKQNDRVGVLKYRLSMHRECRVHYFAWQLSLRNQSDVEDTRHILKFSVLIGVVYIVYI